MGIMVEPGGRVAYVKLPFDVADELDREAVDAFARDREPESQQQGRLGGSASAAESFAKGAESFAEGDREAALSQWRDALGNDPGNYLIRKQIWAVENPDRFYPKIDWDWQKEILAHEREAEGDGS